MGAEVAARERVRHRLGDVALQAGGRRAASDPRQVVWPRAGGRRDQTCVRRGRGKLLGLVFRAPAADPSKSLRRYLAHGGGGGGRARRAGREGAARTCRASPRPARALTRAGAGAQGGTGGSGRRRRHHRTGAACLCAETRRSGPCQHAASPARTPALPARVLARRVERDQLSPLLRRERSCRHPPGRHGDVHRHSLARGVSDRGRPVARAAHRSHRRPARPGAIRPAAPAIDPAAARIAPAVLYADRKNPRGRRGAAEISRRRRHYRIRVAQRHLARAGG